MAELDKNLRREKINMMLNEEERRIITEKAIKYGFGDCIAEYMRAASIYENIYIEEVNGKTELLEAISMYMSKIREILKYQSVICRNITLSRDDIDKIRNQNKEIIDSMDEISRLIVSTLSTNSIHRIQQRISMVDKYKSDEELLKRISKSDTLILRPSNLYIPSLKNGYLVLIKQYDYSYNKETISITDFRDNLDRLRDIAMQKQMFLFCSKQEDKVVVSMAKYFKDEESVLKSLKEFGKSKILQIGSNIQEIGEYHADNC